MPISPEQLENWFTYHAPTSETTPKYVAIRAAELACAMDIDDAIADDCDRKFRYDRINKATRTFAEIIDANAPDSTDKSAAIRCVRLARNAANEAITAEPDHVADLRVLCAQNLTAARFQANSAIACGGK